MTQERKDELYDQMLRYLAGSAVHFQDMYKILVNGIGMTQEELHEHGITQLDEFFPRQNAKERLQARMDSNYRDCLKEWLGWTPRDLLDSCSHVAAITLMQETAVSCMNEQNAEYLLQYRNPLALLADVWEEKMGHPFEEIEHVVWEIQEYGLGEEYETMDQKGPEMCM